MIGSILGVLTCLRQPWSSLEEVRRVLASEAQREEQLLQQMDWLAERREVRAVTATELIDGRITLLAAAARFRKLTDDLPTFCRELVYKTHRASSDEERHCRLVIDFLRDHMDWCPEEIPALVGQLEAEFRERFPAGKMPPNMAP
jgi:hypothetical protein